jgi:hypothetical protein
MEGCLVWNPPIDWDLLLLWCNNHLKGRSLFAIVCAGGPTSPTYEEYYDISYFYFPALLV